LNHIDRINQILEYIEVHLDTNLDLALLAAKSALSKYHFHRIFKALLGEQPLKYVEKRRLTRAAHDLLNTDRRIVDIAFDFGFGSHESFTRAFKKRFFLTPSQFRKIRPVVRLEEKGKIGPLDLRLSHGKAKPNPTILHKPAFSIAGLMYSGHDKSAIDLLWKELWEMFRTGIIKADRQKFIGSCFHDIDMRNNEVFDYYAGFEVGHSINIPKAFKIINIPKSDYTVFTHQGSVDNIESTYDQIYGNWLPRSEYTPTMDLDIIVVDNRFSGHDEKNEMDILIPITC
jgi:AraC-like DNA-binding protein/predicted transcriptional regulator YdeE